MGFLELENGPLLIKGAGLQVSRGAKSVETSIDIIRSWLGSVNLEPRTSKFGAQSPESNVLDFRSTQSTLAFSKYHGCESRKSPGYQSQHHLLEDTSSVFLLSAAGETT